MIETVSLTRRFDGTLAVDGLSLRVEAGEILAFPLMRLPALGRLPHLPFSRPVQKGEQSS